MTQARVTAIIQARLGSSRLPGKSLAPFAGTTILGHILDRLRLVRYPLDVVVATTTAAADEAIVAASESRGVSAFRGDETDVLGRFVACAAARPQPPEWVLRVCADRPLLSPVLVDELLCRFVDAGRPDYLSNNLPPSYPRGLDLELVRRECLEEANRETVDPYDREHVTPFVYRQPERYRVVSLVCPFGNYSHVNLSVDTPDDLARVTRLHAALPPDYDYRDVLNAIALEAW